MDEENDLDPRIQVELENLNTATDEINKLEIELEEANSTFRILLNESTRRLKLLSKKLGSCIDKARPYYEALEKARLAQIECQTAAVKFQRANEIHAAAKETVALAEQRFMSNSHEWQFDNAWQEMLNHATIKVMDAEKQKADSNTEHQRKAAIFNAAELKVQQLEERFRRSIHKSRPYFEEKQICQDQLQTQKERIQQLQNQIQMSKQMYSTSLRNLELISEEIHKKRGDINMAAPSGPREPGVGAELINLPPGISDLSMKTKSLHSPNSSVLPLPDYASELDKCEIRSTCTSIATSSAVSEKDAESENDNDDELLGDVLPRSGLTGMHRYYEHGSSSNEFDVEELRRKVKVLAIRPVEGGDGEQQSDIWANELNTTVDKLDHLMLMRECAGASTTTTPHYNNVISGNSGGVINKPNNIYLNKTNSLSTTTLAPNSLPTTPAKLLPSPIKMLKKADPLPLSNVSMRELTTIDSLQTPSTSSSTATALTIASQLINGNGTVTNEIICGISKDQLMQYKQRKLSLQ